MNQYSLRGQAGEDSNGEHGNGDGDGQTSD